MSDDRAAAPVARAPLPEHLGLPLLAILLFFLYFFWQSLAAQLLVKSNFFGWREGAAIAELATARDDKPETRAAHARLSLWSTVLGFPFFLATLPVLFHAFPAIRPRDLGLTRDHLARHVWIGLRVGLLLTPLVLLIFLLVQWWYTSITGGVAEEHPYSRLAESGLNPFEWLFLFLGAVVVAPVNEELLFRGVLLRWFLHAPAAGWGGMILAAGFAGLLRWTGINETWPAGGAGLWRELSPLLFVLILFPHFLILRKRTSDPAPAAIFASAVVFAAFHSFAWPTPVPLLILGIGLGWLANRQRSLAGPIVVHALFNSFAFIVLLLGSAAGK